VRFPGRPWIAACRLNGRSPAYLAMTTAAIKFSVELPALDPVFSRGGA
jgi:hypothetical protein